jgi:hypothetical protein
LAVLILLFVPLATGCRPTRTPPAIIANGTIVLVRNGRTNAAFVVTRQSLVPETLDYTWFIRSDGKTTFDSRDPGCATGSVTNALSVAFGPFNIGWSSAGNLGAGYVYYPDRYRYVRLPFFSARYVAIRTLKGPQIAITTERDIARIDALDPRWKFQR